MTPTDADREAAREWAERHGFLIPFNPPTTNQLAELVAAGRAAGREVWTKEPPTVPGFWWFRCSPAAHHRAYVVELFESDQGLRFASDIELVSFVRQKQHPACQWSDRPIPTPQEPRP